jgi:hypothetical protein
MNENFPGLDDAERLKAENDFLKMKLMLENGAEFGEASNTELPAEIENQFLKNMIEFETQYASRKTIKVFDRIGRPRQFVDVNEVPDEIIDEAWDELSSWLQQHGIFLDVCSPNVTKRELYRFTTEELFTYEMDDINIPGMMHGFIYDEFHPDPVYETTRVATNDCMQRILSKAPLDWTHQFKKQHLRLNDHTNLALEEFKALVNRFKSFYEELEIVSLDNVQCTISGKESHITGHYSLKATLGKESLTLQGSWEVFIDSAENDYWQVRAVRIEGIDF